MYFDTPEEYTEEIALVRASIRRTLESQKYGLRWGGTDSENQRVTLAELQTYLKALISERDMTIAGSSAPATRIFAKPGRRF